MKKYLRRPVVAWALYDWANSAFALAVMSAFFPVLYGHLGESANLDEEKSSHWFFVTLSVSSLVVAISAPLLGAIADRGGSRKKFLATFALLGVVMTAALYWVQAGEWQMALLVYALGTVGFSGANIFYDSLLIEVAEQEEYDQVSAFGYALGYLGSGLLLAFNAWMVSRAGSPEGQMQAIRWAFLSVAVWWAVFTVPLLVAVRESSSNESVSYRQAVREGITQLRETFGEIRKMKVLVLFLIAYWLYIDGVNTVIRTAALIGKTVLNLEVGTLMGAMLLTQAVAFPAALFFGWLGKRIGPRRGILIGLAVYIVMVFYAWKGLDEAADFYLLGVAVGLVQGGVQSLSRSLFARLIPKSKAAEFFGFFNMIGKFASILGPLLMIGMPLLMAGNNERDFIVALNILFIVGGFLLWRVDVEAGVQAAKELDD